MTNLSEVVGTEDINYMKAVFGYTHSVQELIELDHRRDRYRRRLNHSDIRLVEFCDECKKARVFDQVLEAREQLLLTELLGDTLVIRNAGYKTMRRAVVEAVPCWDDKDKHKVEFDWEKDPRPGNIRLMPRVDVVIEGERQNVWDDGEADLSEWDRGKSSNSAKPCNKKYEWDEPDIAALAQEAVASGTQS